MGKIRTVYEEMLRFRESVGYDSVSCNYMLHMFIDYCEEKWPEAETITKEMLDSWLEYYCYSNNSQAAFISSARYLAKFFNYKGLNAFVPDEDYILKRIPFKAYVPSDDELKAFFDAVDSYTWNTGGKKFKPEIVLPVMFRMMFCLGMRPGEPLRLYTSDVDSTTGDIYIRDTKRHRDRHILMSDNMCKLCRAYESHVSRNRTWYFEVNSNRYHTGWMTAQFNRLTAIAGIPEDKNFRPYDLRHTFASKNITRWLEEGKDAMTFLPLLSQYMGHSNLDSTFYYIHLIPDQLRKSTGVNWDKLAEVYGGRHGN